MEITPNNFDDFFLLPEARIKIFNGNKTVLASAHFLVTDSQKPSMLFLEYRGDSVAIILSFQTTKGGGKAIMGSGQIEIDTEKHSKRKCIALTFCDFNSPIGFWTNYETEIGKISGFPLSVAAKIASHPDIDKYKEILITFYIEEIRGL